MAEVLRKLDQQVPEGTNLGEEFEWDDQAVRYSFSFSSFPFFLFYVFLLVCLALIRGLIFVVLCSLRTMKNSMKVMMIGSMMKHGTRLSCRALLLPSFLLFPSFIH